MVNFGQIVKELREFKGLTQAELAKAIGVSHNSISQYESGARRPSYEVLILMVKFFDVTAGQLLGTEEL